jgi:CPA2 family monovalent cation:H+ antiporter-2
MSLASYGVPLVVVESNPEAVEEIRKAGIPHVYGDAFSPSVLERAGAKRAACVVIAIPDPVVAIATIDYVRHENPEARIIARAHHLEDVDQLKKAGACAIVQPEFEASLELLKVAMVGMNRDMVQVEAALKDLRRYSHLVYHPELTTPETI